MTFNLETSYYPALKSLFPTTLMYTKTPILEQIYFDVSIK